MGKDLKGKDLGKGITQRKDKIYQATYTDRYGKRRYIYDSSLAKLKQKLKEEKSKDELGISQRETTITLGKLAEEYVKYKSSMLEESSVNIYFQRIDKFGKLNKVKVSKLTTRDIMWFYGELSKYSHSYILQLKSFLMNILDYAVDVGYIERNKFKHLTVKSKKKEEKKTRFLTEREINILIEYIDGSNHFYKNLIKTMLSTGMRISECAALKKEDYDDRFIHVTKQLSYLPDDDGYYGVKEKSLKTTSSYRLIPLNTMARTSLEEERAKQKKRRCDYIFTSRQGTPVMASSFDSALGRMSKDIQKLYPEFPMLTSHMLRHSFASLLFKQDINSKTIQQYLGHKNLSTTLNVYVDAEIDTEAIKYFDQMM